jgi:hypothetical protein
MRASKAITRAQTAAAVSRLRNEIIPRTTADVARRELQRVRGTDQRPYTQIVDGHPGAPLESVRPGGRIVFRFPDLSEVLDLIYRELVERSPVGPERGQPHYYEVHWLFADGARIEVPEGGSPVPVAGSVECRFVNARPYARRLEHGWSVQAPDGVYELVAMEAAEKYPWTEIDFAYVGEAEVPAAIPWPTKSWYRFPSITVKARA